MERSFSVFTLRETAPESLKKLLHDTTYGTNGACYRHLDTLERIEGLDNPLHLSLDRNEKILGNCTFCRRNNDWYIRFFSFDVTVRSNGKQKVSKGNSVFKKALHQFFTSKLVEGFENQEVHSFYAYIEPKNIRSIQMSEQFGFGKCATVITQTFSRIHPQKSNRLTKFSDWEKIKNHIRSKYANYNYYFEHYTAQGPFYVLKNENGEIIAGCKYNEASWEIKRLPGKNGGLLTKIIPFIPGLNKIIRPKHHTFIAPEAVFCKNDDPILLQELFEGMLFDQQKTLLLWWVDEKDPIFTQTVTNINWGILDKLVGKTAVNVMRKANTEHPNNLHYVSTVDMI